MSASTSHRLGFRRWYERRLYECFAWLTTCLLSGVLVTVIIEFVGFDGMGARTLTCLALVYLAGLLGITAFARFWKVLSSAQRRADAATCSHCGAYGLFDLPEESDQVLARCTRCGHGWTL